MSASRKRKAAPLAESESKQTDSSERASSDISEPTLLPQPSLDGWNGLPAVLFQHVCSYLCLPVYDTLLCMSAVCRQWSHTLDSGDSTGFDCWRYVPTLTLRPRSDQLVIQSQRIVPLPTVPAILRSLRRVRYVDFLFFGYPVGGYSALLSPFTVPSTRRSSSSLPAFSRPSSTGRVSLEQLSIDLRDDLQFSRTLDHELFSAALSHFLLHSPPLRSFELYPERGQWRPIVPSSAALRRLGSGPLVHLELEAAALDEMVWADNVEVTRPWKGAAQLQSLVLHSPHLVGPDRALIAVSTALPSLTHLHLPEFHDAEAIEYIMRRLGSRLTFLRLTSVFPSSPLAVQQCSALQSLHVRVGSSAQYIERVLACLPLLPQLRELALVEGRGVRPEHAVPIALELPLLPHLTYLQLHFLMLNVALQLAPDPSNPSAILPPSLLCLTIALPAEQLASLVAAIATDCSQLTHCYISCTDGYDEEAEWRQRVMVLRSMLGAGVWCDSELAVEQQRLDRRWQRGMGLRLVDC